MTNLAHDIAELLRLERLVAEARAEGQPQATDEELRLWECRRAVYFRVAQECRTGGDVAGMGEANRAAGHAVTMVPPAQARSVGSG